MIYIHEGYYLKTSEEGSRRDNDFRHTESKKLEKFMLKKAMGYLSPTEKIPRPRIPVHYEQLSKFERGRIIGLKEAGFGKIGESLIIRFEAMRSLKDAGKKG
ncbi:hypothetical protein TNCV_1037551 [Trichonephila clavipes]|nr:hypothetical protein TNCV_1037551 [Trichonephila clavipes]